MGLVLTANGVAPISALGTCKRQMMTTKKNVINQLSGFLVLVGGNTLAQATVILASPVLTRLYSPSEFGEFAYFTGIGSLLAILSTLRYHNVFVMADEEELGALLKLVTLTMALVICIATICVIFIGNQTPLNQSIYLVPAFAVLIAVFASVSALLNRSGKYKQMSGIACVQAFSITTLSIAFPYLAPGSNGLIWSAILSYFVALLFASSQIRLLITSVIKSSTIGPLAVASKYSKFPKFDLPADLAISANQRLPAILFSEFFGLGQAGQYSVANRVLGLPMIIAGNAASQVCYKSFADCKENSDELSKLANRVINLLGIAGAIPLIVISVCGPSLFETVFGHKWSSAGEIATYLVFYQYFVFSCAPVSSLIWVLGKQKEWFIFNLGSAVFRLSVLFSLCWAGCEILTSMLGFVVSGILTWLVYLLLLRRSAGIHATTILHVSVVWPIVGLICLILRTL